MDSPTPDLGQMASSIFQRIIAGENVGGAMQNVLNSEGERVCYEGLIARLYDSRWMIFLGTAGAVGGLVALGAYIKGKVR